MDEFIAKCEQPVVQAAPTWLAMQEKKISHILGQRDWYICWGQRRSENRELVHVLKQVLPSFMLFSPQRDSYTFTDPTQPHSRRSPGKD